MWGECAKLWAHILDLVQVASSRGLFSCLWHFIIKKEKRKKEKKKRKKRKKKRKEKKKKEEKRFINSNLNFQALLILSFHLCLLAQKVAFYAGATPELESVYYNRIGTYMYILCTKQLLSNTDQAYIMYKYIRLICIEFVFMYILFCPAYDI